MSRNIQHLKIRSPRPEELREKEWWRLEDRIMERALALWRRKGRAHLEPLNAWRRAELEILSQDRKARVRAGIMRGKNRGTGSHGNTSNGRK
jgi:hypothetical protein